MRTARGGWGNIPSASIHALLHLPTPPRTRVVNLLLVRELDLIVVENRVHVRVEHQTLLPAQQALPLVQSKESIPHCDRLLHAALPDDANGLRRPLDNV